MWLRYMAQHGQAPDSMLAREAEMMAAYRRGELEMQQYMAFTQEPMRTRLVGDMAAWVQRFINKKIEPIVFPHARTLIQHYQTQGYTVLVVSATGEHLVGPIGQFLGADDFLAIELCHHEGRYTGETQGVLTFQHGKVTRLHDWQR